MRKLMNFLAFAGLFAVAMCLFSGTAKAQYPTAPSAPPAPYTCSTVQAYQAYVFQITDFCNINYGSYVVVDEWDLGKDGWIGTVRYIGPQQVDTSVLPVSPPVYPAPDQFALITAAITTWEYFNTLQDPGSYPYGVECHIDDNRPGC